MSLNTMTHARLRLAQGDTSGARRILDSLLEADPDHHEARALLEEVGRGAPPRSRRSRRQRTESTESTGSRSETVSAGEDPVPGRPARSRDSRVDRLERFMHALGRQRPPTA